jgi:hypothetical protein
MRHVRVVLAVIVASLIATPAVAQRGVQLAVDEATLLVNKRLGEQQWAIVVNFEAQTVEGNVFNLDGSDPQFVWCTLDSPFVFGLEFFIGVTVELSCFAAEPCGPLPCGGAAWQSVGPRSIPGQFFLPSGITLPTTTPRPTSTPHPTFAVSGAARSAPAVAVRTAP